MVQAFARKKYVITTTHLKHRHTVGIDHYYFSVRIKGKTILLNIWDHAGDDEYAMMNDLFISNNSLIWLVVSLRDYCPVKFDENEAIFQRYIGHWLLQVMSHNLAPVVWIVCTHQDLNHWNKLKTDHIRFWKDRLCEKVQESLKELSGNLCHQNVPLDLKEYIRIIELSNTYSFDGLDRLCNAFEELPSKYFCDLTSPLPVEWKTAFENLETYAERELLSHQCIPALITTSEDFKKILVPNLHKDAFLDDTGEIYCLKLNDEEIVVLNVDWMINLLKQVYHLNFNDELKLARKASVCEEMIDDCPSMRENCGLIAEPILKSLWKCSGQKELLTFQKITTLFEKFNLTYRVEREKYGALQIFYFFPYLTKSSFPSKFDWKLFQKGHVTLRFSFKFFLPKLFLQRLALHFWRDNDKTIIYKDGFEAVLEDGVHLNINCVRRDDLKPYADEMNIFASFAETDALWPAILVVLDHIHSILGSWKFGKNADVFVICPKCQVSESREPNFIRLMQFTECLFADIFHSRSALYCTKCRGQTFIRQLIPSPHLKFPDFVRILSIAKEKDFTSNIISRWELRNLRFQSVSGSSGHRTHPPVRTYSEGCRLGESDSSSSRQSSYSAHTDFFIPVEEVEDNN